jgi:riboflavin kinase
LIRKDSISFSGTVVSGLGEGRHYMAKEPYRRQFIRKLNIDPYRGTLNLKLSASNSKLLARIGRGKGISINGFKRGRKTFGKAMCYPAAISGIRCALVIPELSKRTDVAEIISSERLRARLKLKEGSRIRVSVRI